MVCACGCVCLSSSFLCVFLWALLPEIKAWLIDWLINFLRVRQETPRRFDFFVVYNGSKLRTGGGAKSAIHGHGLVVVRPAARRCESARAGAFSASAPCASWTAGSSPGSGTSRRTCPPLCRRLLHTTNRSIVFSTWRQSAPPTVIHAHISLSAHQMTHRSVHPFLQSAAVCSINKWTVTFATRCLLFITRRVFLQAGKTSVNIFSPGQGLKISSPRSKLLLYKFLINLYKSVFIPARRYASALSTVAMRLWQIGVRSKRTDRSSWFFGVAASFYLAYTVL